MNGKVVDKMEYDFVEVYVGVDNKVNKEDNDMNLVEYGEFNKVYNLVLCLDS
jgi:hypothetical protein